MPLLPFASCGDVSAPADCGFLYDVAETILATATEGLTPFIPPPSCGDTFTTFVSHGKPVAETYDALSVHIVGFGPGQMRSVSACATGVWPPTVATFRIELWENCYPVATQTGLPSPDELNDVNMHLLAHGAAIYNAVFGGWVDKTMALPPSVTDVAVSDLAPLGPQGGAAGWGFTVSVEFS